MKKRNHSGMGRTCRVNGSSPTSIELCPAEKSGENSPHSCSLDENMKSWLFPIAFGNQTISTLLLVETHGFASLPHGRFALIVCNYPVKTNSADFTADIELNNVLLLLVNGFCILLPRV